LIYLNDDFEGGETDFILANRTIIPKKGKAILFYNVDINLTLIPESVHVGRKVRNGTKWIANKWIRVFPFRPHNDLFIAQNKDVPWLMHVFRKDYHHTG
jgi:prolyl 4-hydroxylase